MLGAIKIRGNSQGPSLFRVLSRRWQPLMTPARRERPMLRNALALEDDDLKTDSHAWIGGKRAPRAVVPESATRAAARWSPWMWVR
jgi:hypothetical protein